MAADVPVTLEVGNSCCAEWKQKCSTLQKRRKALREALDVVTKEYDSAESQNSMLKKAHEEERTRADIEKEEKERESAARVSLEKEISGLKSEIISLKQGGNADAQDKSEVYLLKVKVSDCEKEINNLKELFEREKNRAASESKNAQVEKKKASEAQKAAKAEKIKADEEMKRANIEREKAENYALELNLLKAEVSECNKEINCLKELVEREKKCADLESKNSEVAKKKASEAQKAAKAEKSKTDEERKRASVERDKAENYERQLEVMKKEKCNAEHLSLDLVESRRRIDELQKVINDIRCSRELHKAQNFEETNKWHETEIQKAVKDKKRAESEMVKAEKQKKLVEVNWKKAIGEKSRADILSRQLDEAKKKIQELSSRKVSEASAVVLGKDVRVESVQMKHLKKELKFEKKQKKHAKEVANLERSHNGILKQELGRMKLEFDQFSQRLGMLNNSLSHSAEGIDDPRKMNLQREGKLMKSRCPVSDASDPFREALHQTVPFHPLSGGNCIDSISGIDSMLDSPVGGSNRKMLQTSAVNSRTTFFSDRQLVGSQEKGGFSLTSSEKLVDENVQPAISNLSAEAHCNKNFAMVSENSVRSPGGTNGVGRAHDLGRKRKRILHAVESIENLYAEGRKLHLRVEENLSVLNFLLHKKIEKPFEEGRYLLPSPQGNSYAKCGGLYEKGMEGIEEKLILQNYADSNKQKKDDKFENEVCGCANVCGLVSQNSDEQLGITQVSREGINDFEVIDGSYLKLLDLENDADEERYRMSMEMPLSPTLPEIEFQGVEAFDVEINSNSLNLGGSGIMNNDLLHKNGGEIDSFDMLGNSVNVSGNCGVQDSGAEEMSNAPYSRNEKAIAPFGSEPGSVGDNNLNFYVVVSNSEDSSSISRICHTSRTCITQCSLATHTDWMGQEILLALKTKELSSKEKVCIFFSLLLLNFATAALSKFGSSNWTSNPCLDSFAEHVCSVMSDREGRNIFSEFGCLDESLSFIEDFLIDGRVVECRDASSESLDVCHSGHRILLDGLCIFSRPALTDELVAGSIVLASICAAFDHIGFICELSYNILQTSISSHSLVLNILHVFAYLGGEKYFNFGNYNLVIVLKSIVTYLERRHLSDSAGSCISSVSKSRTVICPSVKCPFYEDAVSVDVATSLLLERLQMNASLGAMHHENLMESDNLSSNSCIMFNKHKADEISVPGNCGIGVNCDVSCCLNKFAMPSIQSDSSANFTLCDLSDLLSLVELVAINMGWEWTSAKIISRLLKVVESCSAENVTTGVIVLLGQLGRLGVDALGYEGKGLEFLRCALSAFLCRDSAISIGLPSQIATVRALLGLIPCDFQTIVQNKVEHAAIASHSSPAESIGEWFLLLPKKQQDLSFGLLQPADVRKT